MNKCSEIKYSIITVTYNAAKYLRSTLESIISQSPKNIELIIIDGNSTDGTQDIIREYQSHISYWISEADTGIYDAMNKGLRKASGDYVWFINAGDCLYDKNTIESINKSLSSLIELPDIIYGDTEIISQEGERRSLRRLRPPLKLTWKSFRWGMTVSHQSFIVRRSLAPEYDLSYFLASDFDWCIRCMKATTNIFNSELILSRFMEAGISSINRKAGLQERYSIMKKYYNTIPTAIRHIWFAIRFYFAKWLGRSVY